MSTGASMVEFDRQVYNIVKQIPAGRVSTYGQIACAVDRPPSVEPRAFTRIRARWVGYALGRCPDDVPWHRVVNAGGRISRRPGYSVALQRHLLEQEGIRFDDKGRIDLGRFAWCLDDQPAWSQDLVGASPPPGR